MPTVTWLPQRWSADVAHAAARAAAVRAAAVAAPKPSIGTLERLRQKRLDVVAKIKLSDEYMCIGGPDSPPLTPDAGDRSLQQ
jgi:hypothetical protein